MEYRGSENKEWVPEVREAVSEHFLTVEFYTAREDDPSITSGGEHLSLPFIYPPADLLSPANEFFPVSLNQCFCSIQYMSNPLWGTHSTEKLFTQYLNNLQAKTEDGLSGSIS